MLFQLHWTPLPKLFPNFMSLCVSLSLIKGTCMSMDGRYLLKSRKKKTLKCIRNT